MPGRMILTDRQAVTNVGRDVEEKEPSVGTNIGQPLPIGCE